MIAEYKSARDSRDRGAPKPRKPSPYPLHDFIEQGDWLGLLHFLSDHPAYDVDEKDQKSPEFMSPLTLACGQGEIECVRILLDKGANYNEESSDKITPLIYASWWGHTDIVEMLLEKGVDVNQKTSVDGTALGYACVHLQPEVVEILLRHGANFNERNFLGWTPLMQAVCMGSTPGYDDGERSDDQAMVEDNPKIIAIAKMLLEAGADINARGHSSYGTTDLKGDTALNLAFDDRKIDIMRYLISEGALLDVQRECK